MKKLASLICLALFVLSVPAPAAYVIGSWEQSPDGWIDWGNGQKSVADPTLMPGQYQYDTLGATLGSSSLHMVKSGWSQTLSIKLTTAQRTAFMANKKFTIDLYAPATTDSGWLKVEEILLNAEGANWGQYKVTQPAFFGWGTGGGGAQTKTLEFDYTPYLADPDVLGYGRLPYWIEIIITTNNDGTHKDYYWDNAQLTVPEPATLSLLGLGLTALLRRKK